MTKYTDKFINELEINPLQKAKKLDITEFEQLLIDAAEAYYNTDKQLITDETYDILIDYLKEIKPKSTVLKAIGSQPVDERTKVKLPYHLGSMDKIKPGSRKLELWFSRYSGPYLISDKLDGLSGLLVIENGEHKLYTRGNGSYGQDVSHLLKYIKYGCKNISSTEKVIIRGEIMINERLFEKKYADKYPKSRSLVAGIVNSKSTSVNTSIARDIEFVVYQLVYPENQAADKQFKQLENFDCSVVKNELFIEKPNLQELLLERRNESKYKMDGIIITDCSTSYPNPKSGNPKHSIAFKMALDEQQEETIIVDVEYNISKNGILKPRIKYEPVVIDGDTLVYTTGFNAKYIKDNKLGPGAHIVIIRSGDVIPYIKEVISIAKNGKWSEPNVDYIWSESGVEAIAINLEQSEEYLSKQLLHFFKTMNVDGMKIGTINKLIAAGFDSINTILDLKPENLLDVAGFNIKSAEKLVNNIKTQLLDKEHLLEKVMTASNVFTGFGEKKLLLIVNYLIKNKKDFSYLKNLKLSIDELITIEGYSNKTAKQFIVSLPKFLEWVEEHPRIKIKALEAIKLIETKKVISTLTDLNIVITGFRDANLVSKVESSGGKIQSGVNGKTNILIVKDETAMKGSKYNKAKELGIEIKTLEEFNKQYL